MRGSVAAALGVGVVAFFLSGCGEGGATEAAVAAESGVAGVPAPPDLDLDVPYVPTREPVVEKMLEMANVQKDDFVIDLGSGDGRIPIAAAKKHGARGFGVDINPQRISEANANAKAAGVTDKVEFRRQDLFKTKISDATVLTMYLLPSVNMQLRPRILSELKPGTRVVSHAFDMEDWKPDEEAVVDGSNVYLWIVPAQAQGRWRVSGGQAGDMTLDLTQTFQELSGTVTVGGQSRPIRDGRVRGDTLAFAYDSPSGPRLFSARVAGNTLTPAPAPAGASGQVVSGWKAVKAS
ncbi:SAM-dependent methyltransferase [Phenylobacterium terrae]|uniref:SAM-dependent methyltransferase n=1 Tax=Phenylobacterium terrae TaxID=2665495 RepID=A0ABW4N479_9CAUL